MKERLAELLGHLEMQYCDYHSITKENVAEYLIKRGVIVLPCKVGDKLYDVTEFVEGRDCPDIYELQDNVLYVEKTKGGNILFSYDGVYIDHDCIGKTVFFTREEAEKALTERSDNDNT